jgi:hypothetical protein
VPLKIVEVHTFAEVVNSLSKVTGAKVISVNHIIGKRADIPGDCIGRCSDNPQIINSQKVKEALQKGWVCDTDNIGEKLGFSSNHRT